MELLMNVGSYPVNARKFVQQQEIDVAHTDKVPLTLYTRKKFKITTSENFQVMKVYYKK